MNKNLKKLGLLIVAAIAMAMGVNSASALKIGNTEVTSTSTITDNTVVGTGNSVQVTATAYDTYVIDVNGAFKDEIRVQQNDIVTLNLNGNTVPANLFVSGKLTITGDNTNSSLNGTLTLYNGGHVAFTGGNHSDLTVKSPAIVRVSVEGIGTIVPKALQGHMSWNDKLYRIIDSENGNLEVAEAYADLNDLNKVLQGGRSGHEAGLVSSGRGTGSQILNAETKFTKATFGPWLAAYTVAKALVDEDATNKILVSRQAEVDAAKDAYVAATNGLLEIANYTKLDNKIKSVQQDLADDAELGIIYTDASLKVLYDAIETALANHDLPKSEQATVKAMRIAIRDAYNNLVYKADYSKINELESIISSLNPENYTAESWANLAFIQGSIPRDLDEDQQEALDAFYAQLKTSFLALVRTSNSSTVPSEPSNPGSTEPSNPGSTEPSNPGSTEGENNNPGSTVNPNTDGTTSDVNTGDNVAVYAVMNIASLIALAGCGLVLRKQN